MSMIPIDPDQYDDEETHDGVVMKTHSSMDTDVRVLQQQIQQIQKDVQRIHTHLGQVILGQSTLIDDLLCCMLAEGHILIEGTPGLGKTLAVKALGRVLDLTLKRVQCTSDLMPNDILGGTQLIQDQLQTHTHFVQGPIFTQLLFVDEINRANPRTQSALLEAMAERQVSIEGKTQPLPTPFMLLATQNPLDQEGTYALPDAQADRFMFKIILTQPPQDVLAHILTFDARTALKKVPTLLSADTLLTWQSLRSQVVLPQSLQQLLVQMILSTRPNSLIAQQTQTHSYLLEGVSPRAAQDLYKATQARALLAGRMHAQVEDLKACLIPVLRHRIKLHWEAHIHKIDAQSILHTLIQEIF